MDELAPERAARITGNLVSAVLAPVVKLRGDDAADPQKVLRAAFGEAGEVVASLLMLAARDGHAAGCAQQTEPTDRAEILGQFIRKVHHRDIFGDCVEDGEPYPCKTIRAIDLVIGPLADADRA